LHADLRKLIETVRPLERDLEPKLRARLNDLTKPPGSLGKLEEIAVQCGLIRRTAAPRPGRKVILTFAADHGVADENLSIAPKAVTRQMVLNMLAGGAGVNVLARHAGADLRIVDVGVDFDFPPLPGLVGRKVRRGTANIRLGPAMSTTEAEQAILAGASLAADEIRQGAVLLGTGEMGIANTTPTSALLAVLLPCEVDAITGRGTGISDDQMRRKLAVIREALEVNRARLTGPVEALAAVGGLEIAAIAGVALAGAAGRVPVVVDGFISSAGALVACRLCPAARDYLLFSHRSEEKGHDLFLRQFGAAPLLSLNLRLGEGTGAALAMTVVDAALKLYHEMATFSGAGVTLE
jgi:nicotinate-nucleotide--dimethylbenzimidazole phosphoribosyltransferase